ncbi:hypothetical protein ONE63_003374 [Megalurothrips usitatus]|uniref:Uncharacterized protein n=1 Tax=Megalurothrips usitatus TaxID=439358 RepID=A0AAV7XBB7_9NEOP|nr:hypothetical protein ONE63_003374 [Megalurothrips usitatus]
MAAAALAVCACLCWACASARLLRPGLGSDPWSSEVGCALPFLVRHLLPASADGGERGAEPGRLYVVGDSPWLGAVLTRLPTVATVTILPAPAETTPTEWPDGHVLLGMSEPAALILVVGHTPARLAAAASRYHLPTATRKVFWTSGRGSAGLTATEKTVIERGLPLVFTGRDWLAVTAAGATRLYAVGAPLLGLLKPVLTEADRWLDAEGRWQLGAPVFSPPCSRWPRARPAERMSLLLLQLTDDTDDDPYLWWSHVALKVVREVERVSRLQLQRLLVRESDWETVNSGLSECRVALLAYPRPIPIFMGRTVVAFPRKVYSLIVVVPKGMGGLRRAGVFAVLTAVLENVVWMSLAASSLVVLAALVCTARRLSQDAVTLAACQVLAPLLGQPLRSVLGPGSAARRAVLAFWLLACLVVVAACQGLLLEQLTATSKPDDIDSLDQLETSGLGVTVLTDLREFVCEILPVRMHDRITVVDVQELTAVLRRVTWQRDAALLVSDEVLPAVGPLLREPAQVSAEGRDWSRLGKH